MTRFYIENFGCRATQADGASIERQFLDRGVHRTNQARDAEIVVLNTCTVTESADKDARASIRRLRRLNPECRILVTGCYAQRAPTEIAALPGVTCVVGNSHKHELAEIAISPRTTSLAPSPKSIAIRDDRSKFSTAGFFPLQALSSHSPAEVVVGDIFAHTELLAAPVFEAANDRTRPNLKVQDGCNNRCSFCVIPSVRGQSRSMPMDRVVTEIRTLVASGYREVVISGINLGRWGRDFAKSSERSTLSSHSSPLTSTLTSPSITTTHRQHFVDLVREILEQTSLEKLRISSVEPMDWSDELINLVAISRRIARHAHVPMQSGSDSVLRRMHRKYRPAHYREKILKIKKAMPTAAIGADVMVGFPGETEEEFAGTLRMIEDLPLTYLHVFTYSPRPGTSAAKEPSQVPVPVARERNARLRELGGRKKAAFMRSLVGTKLGAITLNHGNLNHGNRAFTEALTDNYLKCRIPGYHEANRWFDIEVESAHGEVLIGTRALAA